MFRKIRMLLNEDPKSMREIIEYIECAVILHNILIHCRDINKEDFDEWHDPRDDLTAMNDPTRGDLDEPLVLSREEMHLNNPLPFGAPTDQRRTQLSNYLWELKTKPRDRPTAEAPSGLFDIPSNPNPFEDGYLSDMSTDAEDDSADEMREI